MKAVHRELYQELTPETLHCLQFFFCTAHVLTLVLGDIIEQIACFHDALDVAKSVIHSHKGHTLVHTVFKRVRKDPTYITRQKGVMHLVTAFPTRYSCSACARCFLGTISLRALRAVFLSYALRSSTPFLGFKQ